MESTSSIGIRADEFVRSRIVVLTEENYRVWSTVLEESFKEKRLWGHVTRTEIIPDPPRVIRAAVAAVPAAPGSDAVASVTAITKAMRDHDLKMIGDYESAAAKANSVLYQSLQQKDVVAVMLLPSVADKWEKLAEDYAAISSSMATLARSSFQDFRMKDGDSVITTIHHFDRLVNECLIQAICLDENEKTRALLAHPSTKWLTFMDSYANLEPLPPVSAIFRAMRSQEERWIQRNNHEYEEANYVGRDIASSSEWKRRPKLEIRQPQRMELRSCYCCGNQGHLQKDCRKKNGFCEICDKKGHTAATCRMTKSEADEKAGKEEEEDEKATQEKTTLPPSARRPRLSFAKGTKFDNARKTVEGMVAHVLPSETSLNAPGDCIEWLADSGAGRHVCTDLSLMWNVQRIEEPVRLVGLLGKADVHFKGTVQLECSDEYGSPVVLHLFNTLYVPEASTNLFSLQKVRKANYTVVQKTWQKKFNGSVIKNGKGEIVGHIDEDLSGRGTLACRTILPPPTQFEIHKKIEKEIEVDEEEEEAEMLVDVPVGEKVEVPAEGAAEEEGVGAIIKPEPELGSQLDMELEAPTLPAEIRVEVEPPAEVAEPGNPAKGAGPLPVILALPAVPVMIDFDWEDDSSESESIPVLIPDCDISLYPGGPIPELYFGSVDCELIENEPEIADLDFQRIGFELRTSPSTRVDELMSQHHERG